MTTTNWDGTERPEQMDPEDLADEIAHDLVAPPDDDASDATVQAVMERVASAADAALGVLLKGGDVDEAREAAERRLGMRP